MTWRSQPGSSMTALWGASWFPQPVPVKPEFLLVPCCVLPPSVSQGVKSVEGILVKCRMKRLLCLFCDMTFVSGFITCLASVFFSVTWR